MARRQINIDFNVTGSGELVAQIGVIKGKVAELNETVKATDPFLQMMLSRGKGGSKAFTDFSKSIEKVDGTLKDMKGELDFVTAKTQEYIAEQARLGEFVKDSDEAFQEYTLRLAELEGQFKSLGAQLETVDKELATKSVQSANSASKQILNLQRSADGAQKALLGKSKSVNAANQILLSFGDTVQDAAQFNYGFGVGMRAVGNNITFAAEQFTYLQAEIIRTEGSAGSTKKAFELLINSFKGPGGFIVALNTVVTLITVLTNRQKKLGDETSKTSSTISSFSDKLKSLRQPLFEDAFGTSRLIYQSKDIKSFLSDIESSQQRIATLKLERLNPIALLFSGQANMLGAQAARQIDIIGNAYRDAARDFAEQPDLLVSLRDIAAPLRKLFAEQTQVIKSTEGQLERFAQQYNLTAREAANLAERLEAVNEQVNLNNFLLENSPLAQEIENRRRQLAIFELEAEHGELTVKRAELERSALQRLNQGRAESIFRLNDLINRQDTSDERRKEAIARLGELNASYGATSAVISFLTSFIDSNTKATEENNEALRDQYYLREQARQQAQEINADAQKSLDLLAAQGISDPRLRAQRILDLRIEAARKEGRTTLEQQLLMAEARADYNNTIKRLDDEEARFAENKRDRINKANHEMNMINISQTMEGNDQLEALHKEERDFLFQQFVDEVYEYEEYELEKTRLAQKYANLRAGIQEKESNAIFNSLQTGLQQVSQVFGALNQLSSTRAQVSEEAAKREFETQKKLSYASAVVSAASAAVGVLRDTKGGPFARFASMTAVLAAAAIQIETIRRQQFTSAGSGSDGATASFGTRTTQVEEPREFTMPSYTPSAESEFRGRQTTVEIHADRKQLYSLVHEGEKEYRQIQT